MTFCKIASYLSYSFLLPFKKKVCVFFLKIRNFFSSIFVGFLRFLLCSSCYANHDARQTLFLFSPFHSCWNNSDLAEGLTLLVLATNGGFDIILSAVSNGCTPFIALRLPLQAIIMKVG